MPSEKASRTTSNAKASQKQSAKATPTSTGPGAEADAPQLAQTLIDPTSASPAALLALQRTAGNRALQRLVGQRINRKPETSASRGVEGATRDRVGRALGADLSNVRVHTDAHANQISRSVGEQAVTLGNDIYFQAGAYDPHSAPGKNKKLLTRELTKVARQSGKPNKIQTKLQVGPAGDMYEQEADRVANAVMRMGDPAPKPAAVKTELDDDERMQTKPLATAVTPLIRRQEEKEEEEEEIQTKRAEGGEGFDVNGPLANRLQASRGSGNSLPGETRSFMENRFGADFGNVRVHADPMANRMSQDIRAQAFTLGSDIYFGNGKYNPGTSSGKQLLAHELTHTIQQGGAQSKAGPVQRSLKNVLQRKAMTLGETKTTFELREAASKKSKKIAYLVPRTAVKRLSAQPVPDDKDPNTTWVQVQAVSGIERGAQGYMLEAQYFEWGAKEDTKIATITAKTGLRNIPGKGSQLKGTLTKNALIEVLDETPAEGYLRVQVLTGENRAQPGYVREDRINKESLSIKLKESRWYQNKNKRIIGQAKAGSFESRLESEQVLHSTAVGAAQQIMEAFTSGESRLTAFQRIAFLMAGQSGAAIKSEFTKATGEDLVAYIRKTFAGDPGPEAHSYLLSLLENNGVPSLKMKMLTALGKVDSSGSFSKAVSKIPKLGDKLGNAGDVDRMLELFEKASRAERHQVWNDAPLMLKINDLDENIYRRMRRLIEVERTEMIIEGKEKTNQPVTAEDKRKQAEARDEQLAGFILQARKFMPIVGKKLHEKFGQGKSTGIMGFDSKKLYDDMVTWKSKATVEDLLQIKRTNSRFQYALSTAPENFLMGLRQKERTFITELLDKVDTTGGDTQTMGVLGGLKRQKAIVHRGQNRGWLGGKIVAGMTSGKWPDLETEIGLLDENQRAKVLAAYNPDPEQALTAINADLMAAGFDKEARARITAMFRVNYGKPGGLYVDLWELVEPGKMTRLKRAISPKKWGDAKKGVLIGKAAMKMMMDMDLEGEDFLQVRQDKALLTKIFSYSDDKIKTGILALLGMKNEDDQLAGQGIETRVQAEEARKAAQISPKRWAVLLNKVIEEGTVDKGKVSAGREKEQIYEIATKAQVAAREYTANSQTMYGQTNPRLVQPPEIFLQKILYELTQFDKGKTRKVDYLKERVPEAYAAFHDNKPISVGTKLARARHEGFALFGIESLRKADRQKVAWSFMNLEGRTLLDEWSNWQEFRSLREGLTHAETKAEENLGVIVNTPKNPNEEESAKRDIAQSQLQNQISFIGQIQSSMKGFTLGISDERRRDLKALGLKAEDRIKMEGVVTEKLIKAMKNDTEVQDALEEIKLPFDKYMKQKMKGLDSLQMQRLIDTGRQWHAFSTLGSQLDETARNVKGGIVSTETKLTEGEQKNLTPEEIKKIRKEGGKKTEEALNDRNLVEARFRDMQAKFRERAMLIFKLIAFAIVTGLSMGVGAPLSIGLQVGLEAGLQALEAAFKYFVLRETSFKRIAFDFAVGLVSATTKILTANLSFALQAEMMKSGGFFEAVPWVAKPIGNTLAGVIHEGIMMVPEYAVKQYFQDKELEKVIKEGEDTITDELEDFAVGQLKGFVTKVAVSGLKDLKGTVMGEERKVSDTRQFGDVFMGRLGGGVSQEEQDRMWGRYEKGKKKAVKKQLFKVLMHKDKNTKEAEKEERKDWSKDIRGKEEETPGYKKLSKKVESDRKPFKLDAPGQLTAMINKGEITKEELEGMTPDERGDLEIEMRLSPGALDNFVATL